MSLVSLYYIQHLIVVLLGFVSLSLAANEVKVVTEDAAPLQYISNGKVEGKTTRIVEATLKLASIDAEIKIYPWARAIQIAKNESNTLIYPLIRSPEREESFQWVGEILKFKLAFVSLKSNSVSQITDVDDAKRHRVAVMRNDYTHSFLISSGFREGIDFQLVSEFTHLLKLLYAQKIDTFIADLELLKETAKNMGFDEEQLIEAYVIPRQQMSVYLASSKDIAPDIINTLKKSLETVKASQ